MPDIGNIRNNSGIIAGGDVSHSTVVHNRTEGTVSEDELLAELSDLIADLLKNTRQLPAPDRAAVRNEAMKFQEEIESPDRDGGRVAAALGRLKSVVAVAAPLAEMVKEIAELASKIIH